MSLCSVHPYSGNAYTTSDDYLATQSPQKLNQTGLSFSKRKLGKKAESLSVHSDTPILTSQNNTFKVEGFDVKVDDSSD